MKSYLYGNNRAEDQMLAETELYKLGLFMSFWKYLENSMI